MKPLKLTLLVFAVVLTAAVAKAQSDPGIQAAQRAVQQAQQANEKAIADLQHFSDQNALDNQKAMANLDHASHITGAAPVMSPRLSVKSGSYSSPITVKLSSRTRGTIMYYSTDGWTPTAASTRYTGPITINSTTTLQVVAVSPYGGRSLVTSAVYTFPASPTPASSGPPPTDTAQTVPVHLLFAKEVDSKTAEIGDKIPLTLADDVVVNGAVVARKGQPASVTIIQVDKTAVAGAPGNLEFQIDPLQTDFGIVKLRGSATLEGKACPPNAAVLIPVVGLFTLFHHGHDAVIKSGMPFTAYLDPTPVK